MHIKVMTDRKRMLPFAQAGERSVAAWTAGGCSSSRAPAGRSPSRQGWVGGVYPSAPLKARTAASDGHCAFTRAARSAGLRFAVILLSKAMDREINKVRRLCWHLIHR